MKENEKLRVIIKTKNGKIVDLENSTKIKIEAAVKIKKSLKELREK